MRRGLRPASAIAIAACALPAAQLAGPPAAQAATQVSGQPAARTAARVTAPTGIVAAGAELMNVGTGQRMWSRGLDTERPIASITKVMTAMVIISAGDLNRKIKVTQAAETYAQENSAGSADLHVGDVLTARQLLEGLLLPSGADAAYLLANSYGPGWSAFVKKMNAKAASLGMTKTHFANFDGLPWPTEDSTYSTPHDLLIMARAAMKLPTFARIVSQRSHYIAATSQHHSYDWKNTDLLLGSYKGAIGIKTGYTHGAGYCLLFAADRNGKDLMGVVLDSSDTNASTRFTAATRLLNWGFSTGG